MPSPATTKLLPVTDDQLNHLLDLNNTHAVETSLLDRPRLTTMIERAFLALTDPSAHSLLIAFDQDADYDSTNFLWFRARFPRFVYVDRIIVAAAVRGRGLARCHYQRLFDEAAGRKQDLIVCEVNRQPPNPGSDAFHAALGFEVVGQGSPAAEKQVRYLARRLT